MNFCILVKRYDKNKRIQKKRKTRFDYPRASHPHSLKRKKGSHKADGRDCLRLHVATALRATLQPDSTIPLSQTQERQPKMLPFFAEREGFEPPVPLSTSVFKTDAIDHSAISPKQR